MAMTDTEIHQRIDEFRELEDNWDTYGAVPVPVEAIEDAHLWVKQYPGTFDWAAPIGGGLQLETERGNRYFEIVIWPGEDYGWLSVTDGVFDERKGNREQVRKWLEEYTR